MYHISNTPFNYLINTCQICFSGFGSVVYSQLHKNEYPTDFEPLKILHQITKLIVIHLSDHQSNEVMAVGINSVREICFRCPLAMEKDLLQVSIAS